MSSFGRIVSPDTSILRKLFSNHSVNHGQVCFRWCLCCYGWYFALANLIVGEIDLVKWLFGKLYDRMSKVKILSTKISKDRISKRQNLKMTKSQRRQYLTQTGSFVSRNEMTILDRPRHFLWGRWNILIALTFTANTIVSNLTCQSGTWKTSWVRQWWLQSLCDWHIQQGSNISMIIKNIIKLVKAKKA